MKKSIFALCAFCVFTATQADNYKILELNTSYITIGKRMLKKGDVFSDATKIHWKKQQAIKAQNLKTNEVLVFAAPDFLSQKSNTIRDYFEKKIRLSTRHTLLTLDDLSASIEPIYYLVDTIIFESPIPVNKNQGFFMHYIKDGIEVKQEMPSTEENFMIVRPMLEESEPSDNMDETTITIIYHSNDQVDDYVVANTKIIKLPPFIK